MECRIGSAEYGVLKGCGGAEVRGLVSLSRRHLGARLFLPIPAHLHRHPLGGLDEVELAEAPEGYVPQPFPKPNERLG
jgi:hypothetical protein